MVALVPVSLILVGAAWAISVPSLALVLAFVHVAGVFIAGKIHRENLIKSMLTGKKVKGDGNV